MDGQSDGVSQPGGVNLFASELVLPHGAVINGKGGAAGVFFFAYVAGGTR